MAGKSFATSGPMLFLDMDGHLPGDIISLGKGVDTTFTVGLSVQSPLYPVDCVELIVNGWTVARERYSRPRARVSLSREIRISSSCWIAVRASGPAGTEAHANPVYVYVGGKLPFNRDSARHIIARLEGSMEHISSGEIDSSLAKAKLALEALLDGRPSALPLPEPQ